MKTPWHYPDQRFFSTLFSRSLQCAFLVTLFAVRCSLFAVVVLATCTLEAGEWTIVDPYHGYEFTINEDESFTGFGNYDASSVPAGATLFVRISIDYESIADVGPTELPSTFDGTEEQWWMNAPYEFQDGGLWNLQIGYTSSSGIVIEASHFGTIVGAGA